MHCVQACPKHVRKVSGLPVKAAGRAMKKSGCTCHNESLLQILQQACCLVAGPQRDQGQNIRKMVQKVMKTADGKRRGEEVS